MTTSIMCPSKCGCDKMVDSIHDELPTCMVCLEEVKHTRDSMCLSCGHHFHMACGLKWLKENNSCPVCRTECGEKAKKIPTLTPTVASSLAQERLNRINSHAAAREIIKFQKKPWITEGFIEDLAWRGIPQSWIDNLPQLERRMLNPNSPRALTEEQLKSIWESYDAETKKNTQYHLIMDFHDSLFRQCMIRVIQDAQSFQEQGVDFSEILTNGQPRNQDDDDDDSEVEEADDYSDMPPLESVEDSNNIHNQTFTVLNDQEAEIIFSDSNSTIHEAESSLLQEEILLTPPNEDRSLQAPSAPLPVSLPRIYGAQSPVVSFINDEHVTRRSSARLRQRNDVEEPHWPTFFEGINVD